MACDKYTKGHGVHHIQARLVGEEDSGAWRYSAATSVDNDGWITVNFGNGETARLWNHDPQRVRECLASSQGISVLRGRGVLALPHYDEANGGIGGYFLVCVADNATPCATLPPRADGASAMTPEEVAQITRDFGGLVVPATDLLRDATSEKGN